MSKPQIKEVNMAQRWKETSFVGISPRKSKVPVDFGVEDTYGKLHQSLGDLRISKSRESRSTYRSSPRTHRNDVPYTSSMDRIPYGGKNEISMTECEEIGILDGNQIIPVASFQRDIVFSQGDIRRAGSLSTFTSPSTTRSGHLREPSYASSWQKQKVVVSNAGSESSVFTMKATASHVVYNTVDVNRTRRPIAHQRYPVHSTYSNISRPPKMDSYEDYPQEHIYDEIILPHTTGNDAYTQEGYIQEDLYENVSKAHVLPEDAAAAAYKGYSEKNNTGDVEEIHEDSQHENLYENTKSLQTLNPDTDHKTQPFEQDLGCPHKIRSSYRNMMEELNETASSQNLSDFSESDDTSLIEKNKNHSVFEVDYGTLRRGLNVNKDEATDEELEIKKPTATEKKPYLETNLDDLLWLPEPTTTEHSATPSEYDTRDYDECSQEEIPKPLDSKPRVLSASIKRPAGRPPPPPPSSGTPERSENMSSIEIEFTSDGRNISCSPGSQATDPAESTLNTAFVHEEDSPFRGSELMNLRDLPESALDSSMLASSESSKSHVHESWENTVQEQQEKDKESLLRAALGSDDSVSEFQKNGSSTSNSSLHSHLSDSENTDKERTPSYQGTHASQLGQMPVNTSSDDDNCQSDDLQRKAPVSDETAERETAEDRVMKIQHEERVAETFDRTSGESNYSENENGRECDTDTGMKTNIETLPSANILGSKGFDAPPSYAPPPPPPESEGSETLSISSDNPLSDQEQFQLSSPPPRPPSPLEYTAPISSALAHPDPDLSPRSSFRHSSTLSDEEKELIKELHDNRYSPSPPPIPPRPKNIEKYGYSHPLLSLDKRIYENIKGSQTEEIDAEEVHLRENIYGNINSYQLHSEDTELDAASLHESIYENVNHSHPRDEKDLHETHPEESLYANITQSDPCSEERLVRTEDPRGNVPSNLRNEHIYGEIAAEYKDDYYEEISIKSKPFQATQTKQHHPNDDDLYAYDAGFRGHAYETIRRQSYSNSDYDDDYHLYHGHMHETISNPKTEDNAKYETQPHYYSAIGRHQSRDPENTKMSGNDSEVLSKGRDEGSPPQNYAYAVIDKSKKKKKNRPVRDDSPLEEIYENTKSYPHHRETVEEPECTYENLIFFRDKSKDADQTQNEVLAEDLNSMKEEEAIYSNMRQISRQTFTTHNSGSRESSSEKPPMLLPRRRSAPKRFPHRPKCPSPPPSPPDTPELSETPPERPPAPSVHRLQPADTVIPQRPAYPPPLPPVSESYETKVTHFRSFAEEENDTEESYNHRMEVQPFLSPKIERHQHRKQLRREQNQHKQESGNRAMMEFYVNTLTSDSDSDNDSSAASTASASSGSIEMEEDVENMALERTYQVIGCTDTVLDTIEEDVEEDSGAESSGHWMFSADNTDTDSVIHVPAIIDLRPYPVQEVKESESTDSDSTLVVDDEVDSVGVCRGNSTSQDEAQEAGVTEGNSHVKTPATDQLHTAADSSSSASSASDDDDSGDDHQRHHVSRGTGLVNAGSSSNLRTRTRRRYKKESNNHNSVDGDVVRGGGRRSGPPPTRYSQKMLSRTEAAKLFEKHIDDVFDFESLESCESVYGGSDLIGYSNPECISPLVGEEVVFNTSATSQPFADTSAGGGVDVTHPINHERINGKDEATFSKDAGGFSTNQRVELTSKDDEEGSRLHLPPISHDNKPFTPTQQLSTHNHPHEVTQHLINYADDDCGALFISKDGNEDLNKTYIVQNSSDENALKRTPATSALQNATRESSVYTRDSSTTVHDGGNDDRHSTVTRDSEEYAFIQQCNEPVSMDLFGLPVRWTENQNKKSHDQPMDSQVNNTKTVQSYSGKIKKLSKTHIEPLPDNDYINLNDDNDIRNCNITENEYKYLQEKLQENFASGQEKRGKDDDSRSHDDENMSGVMSEYDKPSEGDFTFTSSCSSTLALTSETSREARHYQATTGNLLQSKTCHQELSAIPNVVDDGIDSGAQDEASSIPKERQHANQATMRDLQVSNPPTVPAMSHPTSQSALIIGSVNEPQPIRVGQPQYVKTQRNHEDFSSHCYEGDIKNDDAICQKRPSTITHNARGGQYQSDFPSVDSDTDTDNTDGDYDEEDHFAAELSLRISTVQSEVNSGVRSFRNSDILNVLTVTREEEEAGHEDATDNISPLASQEGSSPEMPDSLRSSEGRSGTRSIETLSEDSGLGDRDVRLTPSSPLPPISESNTRASAQGIQQPLASVTARPRRQEIRQARIAKARSCGDLRAFSGSDTDTEDCDMHAWHSRSRGGTDTSGGNSILQKESKESKHYKSSYANYLQQQYHGQGDSNGYRDNRNGSSYPVPSPTRQPQYNSHHQHHPHQHHHRSHPISGSDGSDEEVRSRYRRHKDASSTYSKPRRHKSLLEFPVLDGNYNTFQNSEFLHKESERKSKGEGENSMTVSGQSRFSRRRPQPISVDLAEEFINQEGLESFKSKSKDKVNSETVSKGDERSWVTNLSPSASEKGGVSQDASCKRQTNQEVCSEVKTNGGKGGGVVRQSSGSWGEEGLAATCEDEVRADMRVQSGWPRAPTEPYPHHHPLDALHQHHHPTPSPQLPPSSVRQPHHQYSSTPAQLPDECQPEHIGHSGNSVPHVPIDQSNPSNSTTQQALKQPQLSSSNEPTKTTEENDMAEVPVRVRTKTYGSHGEVEVYLARADSGRPPPHSASSPVLTPTGGTVDQRITGFRGVTFSPSVKEVNWRESYYEVEPESDENKSDTQTVSVGSDENIPAKAVTTQKTTETMGESVMAKQRQATRPAPAIPVPTMQPHETTTTRKLNGSGRESSTGSSSEHESNEEKGQQKGSGPIWQRFKLPKISSPKSPRPKLLPKPKSLSPRSSDTESSKPSSPTPESESSSPSSPDNKLKKTPPSPKFFTWGSKREKKIREITRPTTAPPPIPQPVQVSGGQVGVVAAKGGDLPGKPESSSVTLTDLNREGIGSSPNVISVKKHEVITSDSSEDIGVRNELIKNHIRKSESAVTSSSSNYNSGKEEDEIVDRYSHSVSSSGEETNDSKVSSTSSSASPRAGVAKPPLPPHLQRPTQQAFHKARLLSARRHYFSQERQVSAPERVSPPKDTKDITDAQDTPDAAVFTSIHSGPLAATTATTTLITSLPPLKKLNVSPGSGFDSSRCLKERFEKFSASTRADRERLARSTPDLSVIEASVRRPNPRIDSWTRGGGVEQKQQQQQQADNHLYTSPASASDGEASHPTNAHKGAQHTQNNPRQAIHERYKNRAQRIHARTRTQSVGVLETDLDTGASREFLTLRETNLDDLYKDLQHLLNTLPSVGGPTPTDTKARAKSLLDLEAAGSAMEGQLEAPARPPDNRAKSMEFLLDDGNKAAVQPPENELMKGSERQLSEAELRVRRSLQRLDVPDWMKNAQPAQQGFLLRRRDYGSSSMAGGGGGWSAYSSKTASMTSLGSSRAHTPNTPTKVVIPTRVASKGTTGLGGVTSPASNASISPSPSDRSGSLFQYPISRWSTSRLNSGTTTPTGSVTSTRTTPATYVRQPYLGWRSQTSLASLAGSQSSLTNTGSYLTAADRLALGITAYSQRFVKSSVSAQDKENSSAQANSVASKSDSEEMNDDATTNGNVKLKVPADVADVHSSIKEVTSAIVHYCNESTPSPRASPRESPRPEGPRAPSPRRLVWVESSFVGSRPITSPETPTSSTHAITPTSQLNGHEEPESNEAHSRPPQPPGEYLLAW